MASSPNQVPSLAEWQEEYELVTVPAASKPGRATRARAQTRQTGTVGAEAPASSAAAQNRPAAPLMTTIAAEAPAAASASRSIKPAPAKGAALSPKPGRPSGARAAARGLTAAVMAVTMFLTVVFFAAFINLFIKGDVSAGIAAILFTAGFGWLSWRLRRRLRNPAA